jgi:hypothetical protein
MVPAKGWSTVGVRTAAKAALPADASIRSAMTADLLRYGIGILLFVKQSGAQPI